MQFFKIIVLSVIMAPYNAFAPVISKIHFPFFSINVRKLELN